MLVFYLQQHLLVKFIWIKLRKWKWFDYLVAAQWKLNILILNTEEQWDGKGQVQVLF